MVTVGLQRRGSRPPRSCWTPSRTCASWRPRTTALRLYVDHGATAIPQILRALDGAGLELESIELHRPSLDDVFLAKTGRSLRELSSTMKLLRDTWLIFQRQTLLCCASRSGSSSGSSSR